MGTAVSSNEESRPVFSLCAAGGNHDSCGVRVFANISDNVYTQQTYLLEQKLGDPHEMWKCYKNMADGTGITFVSFAPSDPFLEKPLA